MRMKTMLNEGNQIHNFIPTVSVRTFVIPFLMIPVQTF